jgi:hypothetical protein
MISELAKLRDFAARYSAACCSGNASSAFYSQDGLLNVNGGTPAGGRKAITDGGARIYIQLPELQVLLDDLVKSNTWDTAGH